MDLELVKLMVVAMGVGVPFLASAIWGITHSVLKHRRKVLEMETALVAGHVAEFAGHTALLEERMRVLERIVTDRGLIVADEIDALRTRN